MRKETARLAESARALRLSRTGRPAPHCVKVGAAPAALPSLLADLQEALEAFDAAGGPGIEATQQPEEPPDVERLRAGVDAVFRWIKLQGMDASEPTRLLAEAISGRPAKKAKAFEMLPSYAPGNPNKRKAWKPKLTLGSEVGSRVLGDMDLGAHSKLGGEMFQTALKMGATVPLPLKPARPKPTHLDLDDDEAQALEGAVAPAA